MPRSTSVNITPFQNSLKVYQAKLRVTLAQGLNDFAGGITLPGAQARAPGQSGHLKESGHIIPATPGNLRVEIIFDASYALVVHEDLTAHHDDGEAKYLENQMNADRPRFGPFMAQRVGAIQ